MYSDNISLNKNFNSSVNLEIDLLNENKVNAYIATNDLCDVIKYYVECFLTKADFRSTLLSGPYGKGKSYLMLMITYILGKHTNKKVYKSVCKKIETINQSLYDLLIELDKKGDYLIPVIVNNNNFDDINKNFLLALSNSLNDFGFESIIPQTSYVEALKVINTWEKGKSKDFNLLDICKNRLNIEIEDLKQGLNLFDRKSYDKFADLYRCISQGLEFYSMKSDDIVKVYSDVTSRLKEIDPKCKGLFIVFDEFGSFLNNQINDFSKQLNKIQNLAEKCNSSSKDSQMNLCCIVHKDIALYKKDKQYNDAFDTISGRFKQIRFDRSLEENYQIICSAFTVEKNLSLQLKSDYKDLISEISESMILTKNQVKYLTDNGLPFNPLSIYSLINISEKLGQNERTLFTFLSDNDSNGFKYFITNNDSKLLNVDTIYDYFESIIKNNEEYKMLYYKIDSLIKMSIVKEEQQIFKAIAIIKIINDEIKLRASVDNICMCLGKTTYELKPIIENLLDKNVLKKNINNGTIDFAVVTDESLSDLINTIAETKFSNIDISKELTLLNKNKYHFSNEYNFKHKMVRFYRTVYCESTKLLSAKKIDYLTSYFNIEEKYDGLLINIINNNDYQKQDIINLLKNNNKNYIVCYNEKNFDKEIYLKLQKAIAAKHIINTNNNIGENALKSLQLFFNDLEEEITNYLQEIEKESIFITSNSEYKNLNNAILDTFELYYNKTIVFNNEQLNKNCPTSVTCKARNNIMDKILGIKEIEYSQTSQEMTILNSLYYCSCDEVIEKVKSFVTSGNGKKQTLSILINELENPPYGIRNGIIPLLLSKAFSELTLTNNNKSDMIILYNENKEIELNGLNLSKSCVDSEKYYVKFSEINNHKIAMIKNILDMFKASSATSMSQNISNAFKCIKKYFGNLPPVIVKSNINDNILELSDTQIRLKNEMLKVDLNENETIFETIPSILNCKVDRVAEQIKNNILLDFKEKTDNLYSRIINEIKDVFSFADGSLKTNFDRWLTDIKNKDNVIFEKNYKKIFNCINNISFNENDSINDICFSTVNCGILDLNNEKHDLLINELINFKKFIESNNCSEIVSKDIRSDDDNEDVLNNSLCNTLYSNISDLLEEYGESISNNDKAKIFKKLIKDLMR